MLRSTFNNTATKAYTSGSHGDSTKNKSPSDTWIIPLEKGVPSRVELAFIRKGEKLDLHGRLETILPEIKLPSRSVKVGIALPKRLQLVSLEGPVNPASGDKWEIPEEFIGKHYYFSSSFYTGERMELAISYREPIK